MDIALVIIAAIAIAIRPNYTRAYRGGSGPIPPCPKGGSAVVRGDVRAK